MMRIRLSSSSSSLLSWVLLLIIGGVIPISSPCLAFNNNYYHHSMTIRSCPSFHQKNNPLLLHHRLRGCHHPQSCNLQQRHRRRQRPRQGRNYRRRHHHHHHRCKNDDYGDEELEYQEFLQYKRKKQLINDADIFQDLSIGDQAKLAAVMETIDYYEDDVPIVIFHAGEEGDAMYLISQGTFECYSEYTDEIFCTLGPGEYFGHISLLYKERRSVSVRPSSRSRSSSSGGGAGIIASATADLEQQSPQRCPYQLFKINQQDFDSIVLNQGNDSQRSSIMQVIEERESPNLQTLFERRLKLIALSKCKLFQSIDRQDLERIADAMTTVQVQPGQVLLKQGQVDSKEMYFIKSGRFEVYQETSPSSSSSTTGCTTKLLATRHPGDFFGELSLLLQQPRSASVRGSIGGTGENGNDDNDNTFLEVWVLNKDDFLDAIENSPVYESTIAYLKEKYQVKSFWSLIGKLSPSQVYELAVTKSRPKRETVSFHSVLSTLTFGLLMAIYINTWNPGLYNTDDTVVGGLPRLYDFSRYSLGPNYTKLLSYLFGLIAITGVLRLPPVTPRVRNLLFKQCAAEVIVQTIMQDSNLFVLPGDYYTFDFSSTATLSLKHMMTMTAFSVAVGIRLWYSSQFVVEAIAAPEKGRFLLPFKGNPFGLSVLAALAYIGPYVQVPKFCFGAIVGPNNNAGEYAEYYLPYLQESFGPVTSYVVMTSAVLCLGMLWATHYSEKKITDGKLVAAIPTSIFVLGAYDATIQSHDYSTLLQNAKHLFKDYYGLINQNLHFYEAIVGSYLVLVLVGIVLRFHRQTDVDDLRKVGHKSEEKPATKGAKEPGLGVSAID